MIEILFFLVGLFVGRLVGRLIVHSAPLLDRALSVLITESKTLVVNLSSWTRAKCTKPNKKTYVKKNHS